MTGSLFACYYFLEEWGGHVRILWVGGNSAVIKLKSYSNCLVEWTSSVTWGRTRCSNLLISSSTTNCTLLFLLLLEQVM